MNKRLHISRRNFLKLGGGLVAATAGARLLPAWRGRVLSQQTAAEAAALAALSPAPTIYRHLTGSDGWISIPMGTITNDLGAVVGPDPLAPAGQTTYVFGFRDVTVLDAPGPTPATTTNPKILAQK